MVNVLTLLLPCLMPSWAFFRSVDPSPRVEWRLLGTRTDRDGAWRSFRPRPQHLSAPSTLRRLFWNAHWNETLFVASLAERMAIDPTDHSVQGIRRRLAQDILRLHAKDLAQRPYLQFRLLFVEQKDGVLLQEQTYLDAPFRPQQAAP